MLGIASELARNVRWLSLDHVNLIPRRIHIHVIHESANKQQAATAYFVEVFRCRRVREPTWIIAWTLIRNRDREEIAIDVHLYVDMSVRIRRLISSFFH